MKPSEELEAYVEAEIIPRYGAFDAAHRTDHVRTVIAQSLVLAGHCLLYTSPSPRDS